MKYNIPFNDKVEFEVQLDTFQRPSFQPSQIEKT